VISWLVISWLAISPTVMIHIRRSDGRMLLSTRFIRSQSTPCLLLPLTLLSTRFIRRSYCPRPHSTAPLASHPSPSLPSSLSHPATTSMPQCHQSGGGDGGLQRAARLPPFILSLSASLYNLYGWRRGSDEVGGDNLDLRPPFLLPPPVDLDLSPPPLLLWI
jgi:hypothetical protein